MLKKSLILSVFILILLTTSLAFGQATDLFISEYIEGSGYNKAIEIFNGTGAPVDLSIYSLEKDVNGNGQFSNTYTYSGTLADGDVFVLANSQADQAILDVADDTDNGVINFNGDDQVRLLKNDVELDRIGIPGDVDFAKDVTYVRKSFVYIPLSGPQDPRDNGEWDEYPQNTFDYLGAHVFDGGGGGNIPPNVSNVTTDPAVPEENVDVDVYADITDSDGSIVSATLYWGLDSGNLDTSINMSVSSGDTYVTDSPIPGQPEGTSVYYQIEAVDDSSATTITTVYDYTIMAEYTIYDIQYTTDPSGESPLVGEPVMVGGIVTAGTGEISGSGFIMQDGEGPWNGIWVYAPGFTVQRGDDVMVTGEVEEYYDKTEIGNVTDVTILSSGNTLPNPTIETCGNLNGSDFLVAESYESVLITVEEVTVVEEMNDYGEWFVMDTDSLMVDDQGQYDYIPEIGHELNITGVHDYSYSEFRVQPRDDSDIQYAGDENFPPSISDVQIDPPNPTEEDPVNVSAVITDSDGSIASATLYWGLDSGNLDSQINMSVSSGDTYMTDSPIPAQSQGTTVYYQIEAMDDSSAAATTDILDYTVLSEYTIYDIQYTTDPGGASPMEGEFVITSGIVTAGSGELTSSGFLMQDGDGAWNGIWVYAPDYTVQRGDEVQVYGVVEEYYDKTEISDVTDVTILSSGNDLPNPVIESCGALNGSDFLLSESYESVLVNVENVTVVEEMNEYGEWMVYDSDSLMVDDRGDYVYEPQNGDQLHIIGILDYSYSIYRVQPRDDDDINYAGDLPQLVINEFMADNASTIQDEAGDYDPWLEIYNWGDEAVDMGGLWFHTGDTEWWQIPAGMPAETTVDAGSHLIFWFDGENDEGALHAPLTLDATGGFVGLYFSEDAPIDTVDYAEQSTDISYGRYPDGSNNWYFMEIPTPGTENQYEFPTPNVVINEIYYDSPGSDVGCFTELYGDPGTALDDVTLAGINGNNGADYATIDLTGYTIPDDGFFVVAQDESVADADIIDANVNWQNGPDNVQLRFGDLVIDAVGYGEFDSTEFFMGEGDPVPEPGDSEHSLGRYPDGEDSDDNAVDFAETSLTPGAANEEIEEPTEYAIYDIQYTEDESGDSPHIDEFVKVTGIVTASTGEMSSTAFILQDGSGAWNGIWVYAPDDSLNRGDEVEVIGYVNEYYNVTEIDVTSLTILSSGNDLPSVTSVTCDELNGSDFMSAESYESVLVGVSDVEVLNPDLGYGEWSVIESDNDTLTIGSGEYDYVPEDGDTFEEIRGIHFFSYETFKLIPRDDDDIITTAVDENFTDTVPGEFRMTQNYPNPFNPTTTIQFQLPEPTAVAIRIYDLSGKLINTLVDGTRDAGYHGVTWNGVDERGNTVNSGVYIYKMETDSYTDVKRCILLK